MLLYTMSGIKACSVADVVCFRDVLSRTCARQIRINTDYLIKKDILRVGACKFANFSILDPLQETDFVWTDYAASACFADISLIFRIPGYSEAYPESF